MIRRPNRQTLEALASLEHNPHFKSIRAWLEVSLNDTALAALEELDTTRLRMAQGAGSDLKEILALAEGARSALEAQRQDGGHR